jgi:hypothetical protein
MMVTASWLRLVPWLLSTGTWTHDGHDIYVYVDWSSYTQVINIIGLLAVYDTFTLVVAS